MRVGCILTRLSSVNAPRRRELVQLAEDAGLDHLGVGDHVSFFIGAGFDGLLAAAGVLSVSERLSTNTAVYLLPLRHPVVVARQLADIAVLAPGRFVFGVGIGGEDPHEVQICGVDPRTRGQRMEEALHVVREMMTGQPVDFDGIHFQLEAAQIAPPPSVPIPIVVAGRSDAAIRRAGRLGDGWWGIWVSPSRYAQALQAMEEAAANAGRTDVWWLNALNVWVGVDDDPAAARGHVAPAMEAFYGLPYERFERWSPAGRPQDVAEFLVPYAAAGCGLFNVIVNARSDEHAVEAAASIRELMLHAVG